MNRAEAASPPLSPIRPRRARLRARPSGLKGRCRDRYATGLRSALDPGASTAPHRAATRAAAEQLPARGRGARHDIKINPNNQVSTVSGDCQGRPEGDELTDIEGPEVGLRKILYRIGLRRRLTLR
jgi:hypothetical protein